MKYCIPFFCLFLFVCCNNEKKHYSEDGKLSALYKGKKLVEEYTYHKDNPDILAKSALYHEDGSSTISFYNKEAKKTRVEHNSPSGTIEKLYYNGPSPDKVSRREFFGADSLHMSNFDTLGTETAVVIQSKRFTKRMYRGMVISLHEKIYVNGAKEEWDYHPNGSLNKYKLRLEKEKVDFYEYHNIEGKLEQKRISVGGYHSMYNNALEAVSKDSLMHFFDMKKKQDAKIEQLKADMTKANLVADKKAKYPGGTKALKRFLSTQIAYAEKTGVPHKCKQIEIALFIDKNGKAHIAQNPDCLHYDILSSAYLAVGNMPNWKAASAQGKTIASIQKVSIKI